jgi:hypothetical protein
MKIFVVTIHGDGIRGIGLDLHAIGSAFLGRANDLFCPLNAARMVCRHFRNDVGGFALADPSVLDLDSIHAFTFPEGDFSLFRWFLSNSIFVHGHLYISTKDHLKTSALSEVKIVALQSDDFRA